MDTQNGTLDCESEVGKGTTFTVRIPLGQKSD
jgi:signal transduction histidine kinase